MRGTAMKRIFYLIAALPLCAAGVLAACAQDEGTPSLESMLLRSAESSRMVRTAAVYAGDALLAEEVRIYSRDETGVTFTKTTTALCEDLTADELYTTATLTAAVTEAAYENAALLPFDPTAAQASEQDGSIVWQPTDVSAFFYGTQDVQCTDCTVEVVLQFERPVSCAIGFTLPSGNTVTVSYVFSY